MFSHVQDFGGSKRETDRVKARNDGEIRIDGKIRQRREYSGGQWARGDEKYKAETKTRFSSRESVARMDDRRGPGIKGTEQRGYQGRRDMLNGRSTGTSLF